MDDLVERWNALAPSEYEKGLAAETQDYYDHPCEYGYAGALVDMFEAGQAFIARIQALETSLAEARRQALEEAAKVAEELEVGGKTSTMEWANCMAHARDIAQAIRALADPLLDRQGSRP